MNDLIKHVFRWKTLGVVPSLNLGTGELTDEAQRIVSLQREADQVSFLKWFNNDFYFL
jgi:hypothetical protein